MKKFNYMSLILPGYWFFGITFLLVLTIPIVIKILLAFLIWWLVFKIKGLIDEIDERGKRP